MVRAAGQETNLVRRGRKTNSAAGKVIHKVSRGGKEDQKHSEWKGKRQQETKLWGGQGAVRNKLSGREEDNKTY